MTKMSPSCYDKLKDMPFSTVEQTAYFREYSLLVAKKLDFLLKDMAAKQAEVDALMLEHCPDEMTKEQLDIWAKRQTPIWVNHDPSHDNVG